MRISNEQQSQIVTLTQNLLGTDCEVRLFGSRLDDTAKGGDVDLLVDSKETIEEPALIAAKLSAKISRLFNGRKVDVLLSAPNLKRLPIHEIAFKEGEIL